MAMASNEASNFTYDRPLKVGRDIHWVGTFHPESQSTFNAFIVQDGEEAVLIHGGTRKDLSSLVLKVLQMGILPQNIKALIFHSLCPDTWETIGHLRRLIHRIHLTIISPFAGSRNFSFHDEKAPLKTIEAMEFNFFFSSGRRLEFFRSPFAPEAGSFVTFDSHSGVLFTGKLFGSHRSPKLFWGDLEAECRPCLERGSAMGCSSAECHLLAMEQHHREIIPSGKALHMALARLARVPFEVLAPQRGSIVFHKRNLAFLWERFSRLEGVGIDGVEEEGGHGGEGLEGPQFMHRGFQANGEGTGSTFPSPESCFAHWDV